MSGSDSLRYIYLEGIENHAEWMLYSSRSIVRYLVGIEKTPPYDTRAYDTVLRAEKKVEAAIEEIRAFKEAYQRKIDTQSS